MSGTLNKIAYQEIIDGDIQWLMKQPDSLERKHTLLCLAWCRANRYDIDNIASLREQLADAEAIVSKLPKTTDGVRMVPKSHYWAWCTDEYGDDNDGCMCEVIWWQGGGDQCFNPEYTLVDNKHGWEFFDVDWVCSTREAGLAMVEGQK
jgi:hypothetical protein